MRAIERRLATAQLRAAFLASVLGVAVSLLFGQGVAFQVAIGSAIVLLTLGLTWPIHLVAQRGGRHALITEMFLVPARFVILVALAFLALDNIARSGMPFAAGIALPILVGAVAAIWESVRDPRYYWVDTQLPHVPSTNKSP